MKITWFYSTASAFDATDQELSDSTDLPYGKPAPNFHVHFFTLNKHIIPKTAQVCLDQILGSMKYHVCK